MRNFTSNVFGGLVFLLLCILSSTIVAQTATLGGGNITSQNIGPAIIHTGPSVSAPIQSFTIAESSSDNLTGVSFTTSGTYTTSDITNFALYVNTLSNSIDGATLVPSSSISASGAGTQTISLSSAYSLGSTTFYFFFIVPTFSTSAVTGHTISVGSLSSSNISVSAGTVSGSAAASGTLTIINPTIASSTGASRCGTGSVTLNATPSSGASVNWYSAATGGSSLASGTSFGTPSISTTTTYYAEAGQAATLQLGTLADYSGILGDYQMDQRTDLNFFSSANACTINSVDIYPSSIGNMVITMTNSSGTILAATTVNITASDTSIAVPRTVSLGFSVPAGATNYRLGGDASFDATQAHLYRGNVNGTGTYGPYPATVNGFSYTGDAASGAGATGLGSRCYFYNWNVTMSNVPAASRAGVTATINPVPTGVTATASPNPVCNNSSLTLTGTATGASTYLWAGPGGTGINSTTSLSTSVTGVAPGNAGVYSLTATTSLGCVASAATAAVTVNALPTPTFTTAPGATSCPSVNVTYTTQPGQSSYVWSVPGTAGTNYNIISGGIGGTNNTVTLQWLTTGSKTVTVNYSTSGCAGAAAASNTTTVNAAPDVSNFSIPSVSLGCTGSPVTVTVNSTTLGSGTFNVTYNLSGANSATGSVATMTFSGTSGTFNTSSLASAGSTTVTITSVSNAVGCPVTLSTGNTNTFTVNAGVAPITGAFIICIGGSTTLSDATSGGTWTSTTTTVATIGSTTGFVNSVSAGTTTISYTVGSGCAASQLFAVANSSPTAYSVTGGGSYCAGGTGVHIGLNSSDLGGQYKLFDGSTQVALVTGTGSALDFGLFTASGTYTAVVNAGTSCSSTMSGSATVSVNPLPTAFSVGGGGTYCAGGSGVAVTLNSSTIGVNYQLMQGASTVGSSVAGTGSSISFGTVTSVGTYTVTATDGSTLCGNSMAGSATVTTNPTPGLFSVTGGGNYCLGGTGVHVGLTGSATGINYQLLIGGSPTGSAIAGTGAALDFGIITTSGTYTVRATDATTGCNVIMSGSAVVGINPLPTVYTIGVTNGGAYCAGGSGQTISQGNSQLGIDYQLVQGTSFISSPVAGTGGGISFGTFIAPGSYTVLATNSTTGCTSNMTGSVSISILPLPTAFSVTGGGGYCASGTGVAVGLSGSVSGITYQLYNGTTLVGAASGTGSTINFGSQLVAGTYTATAINATTTCSVNMAGSVAVSINPLPAPFAVSGGGVYCAGGAGMPVGLSGSVVGINYQLYRGITAVGGPQAGTGLSLNFGNQTGTGSYTVVATDAITGCTSNMTGAVAVSTNPKPVSYTVTGGGSYCSGGTGEPVGLSASDNGINYQLWDGSGAAIGGTVPGTGAAITFGTFTTATITTYTVTATDGTTGCQNNMSGSAIVSVNSLPNVYAITGGGNYCAGGTGVPVGLAGSDLGVNYQLFNGPLPIGGPIGSVSAGSPISFGSQTAAGTYTVVATDGTTLCSSNMSGAAPVVINALPAVFPVTGGGNYCSGGTGVAIGLGNSDPTISYQLKRGVVNVGAVVPGGGSAITFGSQTIAGTYTVMATALTGCTSNMTGSVTVNILPLPAVYTTGGGGSYCAGSTGVHVKLLGGSAAATSYQLYVNGTPSGAAMPGTTLPLDFGVKTAAGTYKIVATNTSTGCFDTMNSFATIVVNPLPAVYNVTGGGTYCTGGTGMDVSIDNSDVGTNYQLYKGAASVGTSQAGIGGALSFGFQTATGSYTVKAISDSGCISNMNSSAAIATYPLPTVYNVTGGGNYCNGGSGVSVGLSSSDINTGYQLMNGSGPVGAPVTGTGLALDFGPQTTADIYTVAATNAITGCIDNMSGSALVGINPLPVSYSVLGGGSYCAGGAGLSVGVSGSDLGVAYQLLIGSTAIGTPVAGTGAPIDFGLKTAAGTYSVVGTNMLTGCVNVMGGTEDIFINTLPTAYALSGGGSYCSGSGGLELLLAGSDFGTDYQLFNGTTPAGLPIPGTGSTISFGFQTAAGTYTVVATDGFTLCPNNMTGSQTVSVMPLPTAYNIIGGGSYCANGSGVHVKLTGSNTGVTYQLQVDGSDAGAPMAGTGAALDFGLQTLGGNYTVVATNTSTTCVNTMNGSVDVIVNPLPVVYPVSSTSSRYCAGGGGVHIWLNTSDAGIKYQLFNGSVPSRSPVAGTGSVLDFSLSFTPGSYRVVATDSVTGCADTMSSVVTIVVDPLPIAYAVTGGGAYCAGTSGVNVGLSGSNSGISYQLMSGVTPLGGPVTGTGSAISFGPQTTGSYHVVATDIATTCVNNMSGIVAAALSPIPSAYAVTGTGSYCAGTAGADVGLSGSDAGVNYQLLNGSGPVGGPVAGTGTSVGFGPQTAGTYTVIAANALSGCSNSMAGGAVINMNAAPAPHGVTGGGSYCVGGPGMHAGLSSSDAGINYQLYNGGIAVGHVVAGSGSAIDFGLQTASGVYTVMATNTATGCTATMPGSATVIVNPLPTPYSIAGGGNYCAGGAGVHVGLSNSSAGVDYTLYHGTSAVSTMPGAGTPVDFGLQTGAGTYWVLATNAATGCSDSMTGTAAVAVDPIVVPSVVISNGSDTICEGTVVTFAAIGGNTGSTPLYQWSVNGTAMGVGNTYHYTPVNGDIIRVTLTSSNACASPMSAGSSVTMTVDPRVSPSVSLMADPGIVVCQGTTVTYSATPTYGGTLPTYTWVVNGHNVVASATTYTYVPVDHDQVYVLMTSNYHCALTGAATSGVINMEVDTARPPVITIASNPGTSVQAGQVETLTASVAHGGPAPSYQWYINGSIVPGATLPIFASSSLANNDSVTLQVISSGGCPGILGFNSVRIHVYELAVNQLSLAGDISVVPNPNRGAFTIKGTLAAATQEAVIEITNMAGQVVYHSTAHTINGTLDEQIVLNNALANGMYLLTVRAGGESKIFHVVVEQ